MSLLPSFAQKTYIDQTAQQQDASLSLYEYAVDFNTGQLTGRLVNGSEAVKVWIWKCLMTTRFHFPIYSWMYGSELESYIGRALPQEYIDTDVKLALQDALLINPEITAIRNFSGYHEKDVLTISFTAVTIYGSIDILDMKITDSEYETYAQRSAERALMMLQNDMIYFSMRENGHLYLHKCDDLDKAVTFNIDSGRLIVGQSPESAKLIDFSVTDSGHVEASINV